jgi:hypothetical protein
VTPARGVIQKHPQKKKKIKNKKKEGGRINRINDNDLV